MTRNFDVVYTYNAAESYTLAAPHTRRPPERADAALLTPGRPTIRSCRARADRNCRRCSEDVATTSAASGRHVGTKSKAAIADFEQKAGLEVNGRPSVKVLEALKR